MELRLGNDEEQGPPVVRRHIAIGTIAGAGGHACGRLAATAKCGTPWAHMRAFRDQRLPWFRVTENTCDGFVHAMPASEARR